MSGNICQSMCWVEKYADDAMCDLPEGHGGPHSDSWMGWEW